MNSRSIITCGLLLMLTGVSSGAWDLYQFDVPSESKESVWRDALASRLHGTREVSVEGGRIDVLTDDWAIEVDFQHKWHEGIGQALHYSDVTGKPGALALIVYGQGPDRLRSKTIARLELAEHVCTKNGLKLMVLVPTQPPADRTSSWIPREEAEKSHWLNLGTGVRHNSGCQYYQSGTGRLCDPNDGKACRVCGG